MGQPIYDLQTLNHITANRFSQFKALILTAITRADDWLFASRWEVAQNQTRAIPVGRQKKLLRLIKKSM